MTEHISLLALFDRALRLVACTDALVRKSVDSAHTCFVSRFKEYQVPDWLEGHDGAEWRNAHDHLQHDEHLGARFVEVPKIGVGFHEAKRLAEGNLAEDVLCEPGREGS